MKTFEEALAVVVPRVPIKDLTPDLKAKLHSEAVDNAQRSRELFNEADRNRDLPRLFPAILNASCCQHHALLEVFMVGLRVGMEMERSETGGVQLT